jgi:hypothetical protein
MALNPNTKRTIVNLARRVYNARGNANQNTSAQVERELNNLKRRWPAANVQRFYEQAERRVYSENARRHARRTSPSRTARVNSAARKAAVRLRKPIMNRRIAATIHQIGNILPRNVLEKIIKNMKRISPVRRGSLG